VGDEELALEQQQAAVVEGADGADAVGVVAGFGAVIAGLCQQIPIGTERLEAVVERL
jgi:hypothetical protein